MLSQEILKNQIGCAIIMGSKFPMRLTLSKGIDLKNVIKTHRSGKSFSQEKPFQVNSTVGFSS
jgi:hypothetical protein